MIARCRIIAIAGLWLALASALPAAAAPKAEAEAPKLAAKAEKPEDNEKAKPAPKESIAATSPTAKLATRDDPNRHMIAVEALVVEIDEERTRDLGLHFGFARTGSGGVFAGGDASLGPGFPPVSVPALINAGQGNTAIGFDTTRLPGLGVDLAGMDVNGAVVAARLRALLDRGEAAIRTRPIAVALNGTPVTIETVSNVPYLDRQQNDKLAISEKQVGIRMEVTPAIRNLRTRTVRLDIANINVSTISSFITTQNIDRPVVNESEARTIVTLREGETFVIGGLKNRRKVSTTEGVPWFRRIWLIGWLFQGREDIERNLDVLFFITPYILEPGQNFLLPYDFKHQQAIGAELSAGTK